MLTKDSAGTSLSLPWSYTNTSITSADVPADSYYGFSDGLHTVAFKGNGFTGSFALEATLATTPTANDWFRIPLSGANAKSFTTLTGTEAFTFTGNYVYIKALVFNASAGSVESILLNH
tara:strand:+ start:1633 stop:1989 length:357 start_codon:yes stop_codon:yes gene_type:complete